MKTVRKLAGMIAAISLCLTGCVSQQQFTTQGTLAGVNQSPAGVGLVIAQVSSPAAHGFSGPITRHVIVPIGQTVTLASTFSVKPDCSFSAYNEVRIKEKPTHGTASIVRDKDYPNFAANNPRSVCNGIKLPGTFLKYTPNAGFAGVDYVVMEIIVSNGSVAEVRTSITVKSL